MMKLPKIENVTIQGYSPIGRRAAAVFEMNGGCYHVWFNPDTNERRDVLYKNPLRREARRGDSDYFETRHLDASNQTNRPILDAVFAEIEKRCLVEAAKATFAEFQAEQEARNEMEHKLNLKCEAAPDLYDALAGLLQWLPALGATIRRNYGPDFHRRWEAAQRALAKADGTEE